MTTTSAPLGLGRGVAWTTDTGNGGRVYVASVPNGPIAVFEGTAALIWELALQGPRETLVERVASATEQPVATVHDDVVDFVRRLLEQGWLDEGQ